MVCVQGTSTFVSLASAARSPPEAWLRRLHDTCECGRAVTAQDIGVLKYPFEKGNTKSSCTKTDRNGTRMAQDWCSRKTYGGVCSTKIARPLLRTELKLGKLAVGLREVGLGGTGRDLYMYVYGRVGTLHVNCF